VTQTGILGDMAAIYATIAAILLCAWIRGIVEPTPAALELLQQAHDDYHSPDAVAIRERAAARAAYENQIAAARRMRAAEMQEQREISNTFRHWDSSKA
jgi:hypothetical protein